MTTRGFGMGFFGNPFNKEARKKFKEKWLKMTDSEKLEFMNKRVEMMEQDRFSVEAIDARCKSWMKMTREEKETFLEQRKEAMKNHFGRDFGFVRQNHCFFATEES